MKRWLWLVPLVGGLCLGATAVSFFRRGRSSGAWYEQPASTNGHGNHAEIAALAAER